MVFGTGGKVAERGAAAIHNCGSSCERLECKPFHKKRFQAILKQLRSLTAEEPDVFPPAMASLCRKAGLAAVLVREIKGAPVSGAAKWLWARPFVTHRC
jgi:hypothetical protein